MTTVLLIIALIAIVIVFGGFFAVSALVWDKEPWFRKSPKPSRQYKDDKDTIRSWRLRQRYPEAFK